MFNSETLEVAIGMVFLFLLMSLICTGIKEWIEGIFKWRAMDLERGLRTLLDDEGGKLTAQVYAHPMVSSLYQGAYDPAHLAENSLTSWIPGVSQARQMRWTRRRNLPSYIPAGHFATALIDLIARGPADVDAENAPHGPITIAELRERAAALQSPFLRRTLLTAIDHCEGDLKQLTTNLQNWFDGAMDRASGWYKRRTQTVLFVLGVGAAMVLNVDAVYVMGRLTADKTLRETVVAAAAQQAAASAPAAPDTPASGLAAAKRAREELANVGMPMGWRKAGADNSPAAAWFRGLVPVQLCQLDAAAACEPSHYAPVRVVLGWLVTAFAVMLGAPFWFDLLNKFMVIRSTVKPREKSREEGSEDRPDPTKDAAAPAALALVAASPPPSTDAPPPPASVPAPPATGAFVPHAWRDGVTNPREIPL
jgi:hypothetical protein